MIILTKRDGTQFAINCDLFQTIEEIPETKITLVNDTFFLVLETVDDIISKIVDYKQRIYKDLKVNIGSFPPSVQGAREGY